MRKAVVVFFVLSISITFLSNNSAIAAEPGWQAALAEANRELKEAGHGENTYSEVSLGRAINPTLAVSSTGLTVKEDGLLYGPKSVFVYGTTAQADQWLVSRGLSTAGSEGGGSGESRTLGFSHSGRPFPNPNYVGYSTNLYTEAGWISLDDIVDGKFATDANINAWLGEPDRRGRGKLYDDEFKMMHSWLIIVA